MASAKVFIPLLVLATALMLAGSASAQAGYYPGSYGAGYGASYGASYGYPGTYRPGYGIAPANTEITGRRLLAANLGRGRSLLQSYGASYTVTYGFYGVGSYGYGYFSGAYSYGR